MPAGPCGPCGPPAGPCGPCGPVAPVGPCGPAVGADQYKFPVPSVAKISPLDPPVILTPTLLPS